VDNKEIYTEKINEYIKKSGLEVPKDLVSWSYRWRCFIYSNVMPAVLGDAPLEPEEIKLTKYLLSKIRYEHACNWVRERLYPIDIKGIPGIQIVGCNYRELIIALYFNRSIALGDLVVDDYMLTHIPLLRQYVEGCIDVPESSVEEDKSEGFNYKLTPKYDFWNQDHHRAFSDLVILFAGKDNLKFMEIGALEGRTSTWLLDNVLTGKDCYLTCVDIDPTDNLKHNLNYHKDKARIVESFSSEWLYEELVGGGGTYDFVYVDGDHNASGVLEDAVLAWRALKVGGVMFLDDYEMEIRDPWFYLMHEEFKDNPRLNFIHPHVAIDAFISIYRGQYELLFKNYLVGIRKLVDIGGKNLNHGDDAQNPLEIQ